MNKKLISTQPLIVSVLAILALFVWTAAAGAEAPPVSAPIVREGDFALELAVALKLGTPSSEIEAESQLGAAGVAPRNGWIADYPVTPDIIGELRDSIIYAVQAKTISLDKDAALKAFESLQADMEVSVSPAVAGPPAGANTQDMGGDTGAAEIAYPDETLQSEYYIDEGPPIVTYYVPPPDYLYLYSWVPYPFWWGGVWFGGYFILHDFHREHWHHGRFSAVSNHFNDISAHKVYRIDPLSRAKGRTFAGVGAPKANNFRRTGVQRSPERIFNGRSMPRQESVRAQSGRTGSFKAPAARGYRAPSNPFPQNRVYSQPPGSGRTFTPRSGAGGSRSFSAPSGGGRSFSAPSQGGGGGGGRSFGGGGGGGHQGGGRR